MLYFRRSACLLAAFFFVSLTRAFQVRPAVRSVSSAPTATATLVWAAPHFPEKNISNVDSSSSTRSSNGESALKIMDDAGQGLKPAAVQANSKAALAETKGQRYLYLAKSCLLYAMFILYRGYRGFFVILPAVFRETFRKLQTVVDEAPFDDNTDVVEQQQQQQPMKLRTRVTVSFLAAIVTASYVVGGAIRVATTLIRSWKGSGLAQSFAAAAIEQERNEDTMLQKVNSKKNTQKDVNGQTGWSP